MKEAVGEAVFELRDPLMGSDDFAYIAQCVPAMLFRLGCAFPGRESFPLHSERFDLPAEVLSKGCAYLSYLLLDLIERLGEKLLACITGLNHFMGGEI